MKKALSCFFLYCMVCSCTYKINLNETSNAEAEIRQAETDFNTLVAQQGIAEGFYHYADDDATIKRENDTLIKGKENIKNYYANPKFAKAKVTWSPDFVSVSKDGTLGYTYGKYVWTVIDSVGKPKDFKGVFHTVWKKQTDGSWKYAWD